jgi:hypothetical protein
MYLEQVLGIVADLGVLSTQLVGHLHLVEPIKSTYAQNLKPSVTTRPVNTLTRAAPEQRKMNQVYLIRILILPTMEQRAP